MTDETSMAGEGNQPEGTGWAAPDTGQGEVAESEIPVGVDQIEHEAPAEGDGGGDAEGGTATIDVSALPDDGGTARDDTEAAETAEADADADAEGDAGAESAGDADAEAVAEDDETTA